MRSSHSDGPEGRSGSVLTPDVDPTAVATPVDALASTPDLEKTGHAMERPLARSLSLTVIATLALLYTLYFAREFLIPVVFALLLDFLLSPLVRALTRVRVRPPLGAGLVLLTLWALVGLGAYQLAGPVQGWADKAPRTIATVQGKLRGLLRPIERVTETAGQVEKVTQVRGGERPAEVVVKEASLVSRVFGTTQRLVAFVLEVTFLLYFLLAAGDLFLQKLVSVLPNLRDKRTAVRIARQIETSISTYLFTTALVNVAEGAAVAVAMYLLGMPNPALWGALAALLEFIPYVGAAVMTAVLGVAALTTFDGVLHALLVPGSFVLITLVQGNVVSPLLLADRLALNPVALFVGLAFWLWVWGLPGAFLAVPLLAVLKIFCDHIEALAAIGAFLGNREDGERRAAVREA